MSTQKTVRHAAGTVEENDLRLDVEKAEQIVDALNTDLAATYVLYHQVKKHHWNVEGAEFRDLHLFLGDAAAELEEIADIVAERVQALDGVPVAGPEALAAASPIEFEGEDVFDIRSSLENDLNAYGDVIETVREHVELAEELGDHASAQILREGLVTIEEHAHEIGHYLEDDSLVVEDAVN